MIQDARGCNGANTGLLDSERCSVYHTCTRREVPQHIECSIICSSCTHSRALNGAKNTARGRTSVKTNRCFELSKCGETCGGNGKRSHRAMRFDEQQESWWSGNPFEVGKARVFNLSLNTGPVRSFSCLRAAAAVQSTFSVTAAPFIFHLVNRISVQLVIAALSALFGALVTPTSATTAQRACQQQRAAILLHLLQILPDTSRPRNQPARLQHKQQAQRIQSPARAQLLRRRRPSLIGAAPLAGLAKNLRPCTSPLRQFQLYP